jgi:hypothetical protein
VLERRDERSLVARTNGAESAFATAEA